MLLFFTGILSDSTYILLLARADLLTDHRGNTVASSSHLSAEPFQIRHFHLIKHEEAQQKQCAIEYVASVDAAAFRMFQPLWILNRHAAGVSVCRLCSK